MALLWTALVLGWLAVIAAVLGAFAAIRRRRPLLRYAAAVAIALVAGVAGAALGFASPAATAAVAGCLLLGFALYARRDRARAGCWLRSYRWAAVAGGLVAVAIGLLLPVGAYLFMRGWSLLAFGHKLYVYEDRYGQLPDRFEVLNAATWGSGSYVTHPDGTVSNGSGDAAVRARYLRATEPGTIVLVEISPYVGTGRFASGYPCEIGYIMYGDPSVRYATEPELRRLLAADDAHRAATGQPTGWNGLVP